MNNTKSSITKTFDLIRNILILLITIYLLTFLWKWHWIAAIIGAIPIYIIIMNIIGLVTLPIDYLTPEHRELKESEIKATDKDNFQERLTTEPTAEKRKSMFLENENIRQTREFSPNEFSEDNYEYAKKCIQNLSENNLKHTGSYRKSYKSLEFSKTSIELAFEYLLDSIKFDNNSPIYNNQKFADNLRERHMAMLLTYVNAELSEIPNELSKQIKFDSERKIDIGKNQIEITELIEWRNNEQWQYFLTRFGTESDLGNVCLRKMQ